MIFSMTGYAVATAEPDAGSLSLELRSVNHRYLDLQLRMPDELRMLEPLLRDSISARISRGKVECRINFAPRQTLRQTTQPNTALLQQLAQWEEQVRQVLPEARALSVAEVLAWKGMLENPALQTESLYDALQALLQQALDDFSGARKREGEKLRDFLLERVTAIETAYRTVTPRIPAAIASYEVRLREKLREALGSADDERVRQEITLYASKIDVDEELSRLQGHLAEVRRVLDKGGIVGKRLDFLMQELHREANTLGSKSVDAEVSRCAMDIKILIEQMREQVQNIE
jgi:uncharacterized protein (TIGR00255 family)